LEKRIKYIFFNDKENKSNEIFTNIKSKINEIKTYIENLEEILSYLLDFYSESQTQKKEIETISDIIEKLKIRNISNFERKQNEYKKLIEKYIEEAKKIELKKKSILFNEIYKETKKKSKKKEKRLQETEKNFKKLSSIFEGKGNKNINEIIKYLKPLLKKKEEEIKNELNLLIEIFKINEKNNEDKKNLILMKYKRIYY
jgi:hypothetical protein